MVELFAERRKNQSYKTENIRAYKENVCFFMRINLREKILSIKNTSTIFSPRYRFFSLKLLSNIKKSFTEKFDEDEEKNCESSQTLF